jgi:putative transcriptional regulator
VRACGESNFTTEALHGGDDMRVDSLKGHLLIAGPSLVDPNFWRTVVLVGEHSEEGALGVVLNRASETAVREAVPELAELAENMGQVHVGGPVQPSAIVVLADYVEPEHAPTLVLDSVGFLPSEVEPDQLGELKQARVFVGYAGWGPGQLDGELEEGSWIVEPALPDDVFTDDPESLWSEVLRRKGGPYGVLAAMPPDPSLN